MTFREPLLQHDQSTAAGTSTVRENYANSRWDDSPFRMLAPSKYSGVASTCSVSTKLYSRGDRRRRISLRRRQSFEGQPHGGSDCVRFMPAGQLYDDFQIIGGPAVSRMRPAPLH